MKSTKFILISITLFLSIIFSCKRPYKEAIISTGSAEGIELNEVLVSGTIIDIGSGITKHGHCWSIETAPTINDYSTDLGEAVRTGAFNSLLCGLETGVKYYYRSYAQNGDQVVYGNQKYFTTLSGLATISTLELSGITTISAICGGDISDDNGAEVIARGVCWSSEQNPVTDDSKTIDGLGTGSYTSELSGLTINTKYYIRAYAETAIGISYGIEYIFYTLDGLADVTTFEVKGITASTASCGGKVSSEEGSAIASRGIVWSTSSNPTLENNVGITSNGTGLGSFEADISGLTDQTTYYVRAYATNSYGTGYGEEKVFFAEAPQNGTFFDSRDNNSYKWVRIGEQVWMAENLAFLPSVGSSSFYQVYDYYGSDVNYVKGLSNYHDYGVLYTWSVAVESCPDGWHLPSDQEWKEMAIYLGVSQEEADDVGSCGTIEGGKLKETGLDHWLNTSNDVTNSSGFTALPGGYFAPGSYDGPFQDMGFDGYWWTSTEANDGAWFRRLSFFRDDIYRNLHSRRVGLSVRCIKDN